MSRQLAVSSAFSVLMMACYVLFSADAVQVGLPVDSAIGGATAPAFDAGVSLLPKVTALLAR